MRTMVCLDDPASVVRAEKRMAEAKARMTLVKRVEQSKPTRPDVFECGCGAMVFRAWNPSGYREPMVLDWVEEDEALERLGGWEIEHIIVPDDTASDALGWVCRATRYVIEPDPDDLVALELAAQGPLVPRYRRHRTTWNVCNRPWKRRARRAPVQLELRLGGARRGRIKASGRS